MPEPVFLQTKLLIPPIRSDALSRERLKERLKLSASVKLVLLSAPAGFGKTTLVSDWLRSLDAKSCWLSLDDEDNHLKRFLQHFFTAIHNATGLAEDELKLLAQAKDIRADELLAPLLNQAASLDETLCIVLDDYHLITNNQVHDALDFMLEYAPASIKLCLLTRSDPPLKLARLRASAQILELRSADLRFTNDETHTFLNQNSQVTLSDADSSALAERAEGWAVGLQVMALSLRNSDNPSAFIQEVASSNRFLLDYLLDEVLAQQSDEVQTFLLKTSVLEAFNASLCAAILDPEDISKHPSEMIAQLERANLFILPLDGQHSWFRYHHLFRDVLRHRLNSLFPQLVPALHHNAALWFEQQKDSSRALEQYLKAEHFEDAANLIHHLGHKLIWQQGDANSLARWLDRLPAKLLAGRPDLLLLQAWACHMLGDIHRIEPLLDQVDMLLDIVVTGDAEALKAESIALRSFVKRMHGELDEALTLSTDALERLPQDAHQLRSLVNGNLGEVYYLRGNFKNAHTFHKIESQLAEKEGAILPSRYALWRISDIQTQKGELELAKKTSLMMLNLNKIRSVDALGFADIQLGIIALEQHKLDDADKRLSAGIEMGKRLSNPRVFMPGYGPLAKLLIVNGRFDEAQEVLDEAKDLSETHLISWTWGIPPVDAWQAYLNLRKNKLDTAYPWALQTGLISNETPLSFPQEFSALIIVRILLARNQIKEALDLLERVDASLAETNCIRNRIEIDALKALALSASGNKEAALDSLETALARASKDGYCLTFVDEGKVMRKLLENLKNASRQVAYCTKLLSAFPQEKQQTQAPIIIQENHAEAKNDLDLSDRELSVLRLMSGRLSNKEIARELDLSTNTVKWYAKSIFEKLNVHGRVKAGQKAKELGLI